MHVYCHRCGGELPASDGVSPFCPHCGSPQIYLQDYEEQTGAPVADTTGALPPPHPQQVEWKTAIRCAVLVAGVAAVLGLVSSRVAVVSPLSWVWTISGSLITLALYQRRRPLAWMDAGVGARIGIVVAARRRRDVPAYDPTPPDQSRAHVHRDFSGRRISHR